MKVVHICTSFGGGAGLCAKRIIKSTTMLGVDTCAIVSNGERSETVEVANASYPWSTSWLKRKLQVLKSRRGLWPYSEVIARRIEDNKRKNPTVVFTSPVTNYFGLVDHPWIKGADIVHLHWVGSLLDYKSFFSNINKPVVWTIHDQNPGLGGFHYTYWRDNASEEFRNLEDELLKVKAQAYCKAKNLTLVGISTEMCEFFKSNQLLHTFPYVKIHNGIEPDVFGSIDKLLCRKVLGIPEKSKVFLFCAHNIHQDIKGLDSLIAALERFCSTDIMLLCIGRYDHVPKATFEIRCEGYIESDRLQSVYYSAADFFILPSSQEAFAQTPMEAMACGTPVVAFPCSGAKDLINANNGVICRDFSINALVEGIKTALGRNYDGKAIRQDLIERFSYEKIAKQYVELYESILKR